MSAGIINLPFASSQPLSRGAHDPFRAHAFSSLVAISVLLGSMFTAHSAIVQLASVNAAEIAFGLVLDVRAEILAIPNRASERMAAIGVVHTENVSLNQYSKSEATHFSFESGLEGLFAAPISLGRSEITKAGVKSVPTSEYNALYAHFEPVPGHRIANTVGGFSLGVGENVRDYVLPSISELSLNIDEMAKLAIYAKEFSISSYVQSVYAWVELSPRVAKLLVERTSSIGSAVMQGAVVGLDMGSHSYVSAINVWTGTATSVASSVVTQQIIVGQTAVATLVDLRHISFQAQNAAGKYIANASSDVYESTFGSVEGMPRTATAAVADFLILEGK